MDVGDDVQLLAERDRCLVLDGHPQRRIQQLGVADR
jgi:hypothetical protein